MTTRARREGHNNAKQFIKTDVDIVILGIFLAFYNNWGLVVNAEGEDPGTNVSNTTGTSTNASSSGSIAPYAVLFPW